MLKDTGRGKFSSWLVNYDLSTALSRLRKIPENATSRQASGTLSGRRGHSATGVTFYKRRQDPHCVLSRSWRSVCAISWSTTMRTLKILIEHGMSELETRSGISRRPPKGLACRLHRDCSGHHTNSQATVAVRLYCRDQDNVYYFFIICAVPWTYLH